MFVVRGKNLIQHKIDRLPREVDEVILIVHHQKEVIMDFFRDVYDGRKITYVDQGEPLGTGHALYKAKPFIKGDFLSMMGDDIYDERDIVDVMKYPWAMTVSKTESFPGTLEITTDAEDFLEDAVFDDEGTAGEILLDICLYKLQRDIFNTPLVKLNNKNEWGLPHTIFKFLKDTNTKMKVIRSKSWHKINSPDNLEQAEVALKALG